MKIVVITPDLSGNCVGRAVVLAELLSTVGQVELAGHMFGSKIWAPASSFPVPVRRLAGGSWAGLLRHAERNLTDLQAADLFVISKRLASSLFYAKALSARGASIVLDFDDDEVGLHRAQSVAVRALRPWLDIGKPNSFFWTAHADKAAWPQAPTLVASVGLQKRYGGMVLYHLRTDGLLRGSPLSPDLDEKISQLQRAESVVFVGTPRLHKGLEVLARAVSRLMRHRKVILGVFGADDCDKVMKDLGRWVPRESLICHGNVPMGCVAAILEAAKVVVVPQQRGAGADLQTPAKIFDALCLGRPLVTTDVGDIRAIVGDAASVVSEPNDHAAMAQAIDMLLACEERRADLGLKAAERFATLYAIGPTRKRVLPKLGLPAAI